MSSSTPRTWGSGSTSASPRSRRPAGRSASTPPVTGFPVAPASHYACGGIRAGLDGVTAVRGLYAVGEVACTGVHGANRLASNSLTESVVAGTRVGRDLAWELPDMWTRRREDIAVGTGIADGRLLDPVRMTEVRAVMSGTSACSATQARWRPPPAHWARSRGLVDDVVPSRRAWEGTNLLTVAGAVVAAATARTESRGCHRRTDHPEPRDVWLAHLDVRRRPAGRDPRRRHPARRLITRRC